MNDTEYEALCKRAEALAKDNPKQYRRKLVAFSYLGHFVLFGLLATLIAILAGSVAIAFFWTGFFLLLVKKKFAFIVLPLIWVIVRALWVKFDKPTGRVMTKEEFPELFSVIEELETKLKTPKIHQVLLTEEFNASVSQTSRLGVFGWQHNTLTLGLTLLMTLSPSEARSVIAHELGHLSGSHSAFAGRIYRSRIAWGRVMQAMSENDSWGGALMNRFFSWYAPRFSAYSFALARQNEYEADTIAAQLTSPQDAANALVAVHAFSPKIDEQYWRSLYSSADHTPEPASKPWKKLGDFISSNRKQAEIEDELKVAMAYTSDYGDTHPSLSDRLANLNMEPQTPTEHADSAAKLWLGGRYQTVLDQADNEWATNNSNGWKNRYEYVKNSEARIKEIESANPKDFSHEQMWEQVTLWSEFKSEGEYFLVIHNSLKQFPDDTKLRFIRGRQLIENDNDAGLDDLKASLSDDDVNFDACSIAYHYLMNAERTEEAVFWRKFVENLQDERQQQYSQENSLNENDTVRKASLTEEEREAILQRLKESNLVKKVWIAEKATPDGVKSPLLITVTSKKLMLLSEAKYVKEVAEQLPGFDGWIFIKSGEHKGFAKKVCKIKDRLF